MSPLQWESDLLLLVTVFVLNAQSCIRDHKKQRPQKTLKTAVQRPLQAWTKPMLAREGGYSHTCSPYWHLQNVGLERQW